MTEDTKVTIIQKVERGLAASAQELEQARRAGLNATWDQLVPPDLTLSDADLAAMWTRRRPMLLLAIALHPNAGVLVGKKIEGGPWGGVTQLREMPSGLDEVWAVWAERRRARAGDGRPPHLVGHQVIYEVVTVDSQLVNWYRLPRSERQSRLRAEQEAKELAKQRQKQELEEQSVAAQERHKRWLALRQTQIPNRLRRTLRPLDERLAAARAALAAAESAARAGDAPAAAHHLCTVWRLTADGRVARITKNWSGTISVRSEWGTSYHDFKAAGELWSALAPSAPVDALWPLASSLRAGYTKGIRSRLKVVERYMPDPILLNAVFDIVARPPWGAYRSRPIYTVAYRILAKHGDTDTLAHMDGGGDPYSEDHEPALFLKARLSVAAVPLDAESVSCLDRIAALMVGSPPSA